MRTDNTKSRYTQDTLIIHFFRPSGRTPWWMWLGWRPTYSHVAVEWHGLIHDMPYGGVAKLYMADEFLTDKPSDVSVPLPYRENFRDLADKVIWIKNCYDGRSVQRFRCVLWRFGIRRRMPRSCATLVCLWINLLTEYNVRAVLPDVLFRQVLGHAVLEKQRAEQSTE